MMYMPVTGPNGEQGFAPVPMPQAMGAQGLSEDYPFVRHLAASQVAALVDGSTEMLLERIARDFRAD